MTHEQVRDTIIANIDRNNRQKITGKLLQSTLLDVYNDYQPREPGKGLSTNDFTDEDKNQLDNITEIIEETLHFATQEDIDNLFDDGSGSIEFGIVYDGCRGVLFSDGTSINPNQIYEGDQLELTYTLNEPDTSYDLMVEMGGVDITQSGEGDIDTENHTITIYSVSEDIRIEFYYNRELNYSSNIIEDVPIHPGDIYTVYTDVVPGIFHDGEVLDIKLWPTYSESGYVYVNRVLINGNDIKNDPGNVVYNRDGSVDVHIVMNGDTTISAEIVQNYDYSISYNMTNCDVSNKPIGLMNGDSYHAEVTGSSGYDFSEASISMDDHGDEDFHEIPDAWSWEDGVGFINVPSVTGNMRIDIWFSQSH